MASRMVTTYIEAARALSVPSDEQRRAFAVYVTGAHSWYKHLPILPLSTFVFFLDPNAGRSMVHRSDDSVAFVDNRSSRGIHYTWQTTEAYRRRFGLWNYDAPYGKSLRYMSAQGVVDTRGAGLRVADADSTCWLEIPATLSMAGTALVSSLMYLAGAWMPTPYVTNPEQRVRGLADFDDLPADGERPEAVINAARELKELRSSEYFVTERGGIERTERALLTARKSGARPRETVHRLKACKAAEATWERSPSRQEEKVMIARLALAVDDERSSQIEGMQAAMRRFVEALHGVDQ